MRSLYFAAATAALLHAVPAYTQGPPQCPIVSEQYAQARDIMQRQVQIGEEMRERKITSKADLIRNPSIGARLCELASEIGAHERKYSFKDPVNLADPRYCSTFYGQMEATSREVPSTEMNSSGIEKKIKIPDEMKRQAALSVLRAMKDYCSGERI